ncbi:alpha/beta-hydrolase [Backusella circina FSU 941]|nr:alpha/beta-hydrolase [Backusella circina FSU 941]
MPAYLQPTATRIIPCHRATVGYDSMKIATDLHVFPSVEKADKKIAFLFSHSNGFHKESLHPLMRRLKDHLRSLREYDSTDIHIVAWDARNHGDSARENEGKFTETYRWFDNAMDTMAVIDEYQLSNYDQFYGVGHSFGATSMLLSEFMFPKTFTGLCLTEPVTESYYTDRAIRDKFHYLKSRNRRDEWPDRETCYKSLVSRPFWKRFHTEAMENYVQYGLYDTDKGTVKLKCPPEQEYHVFNCNSYSTAVAHRSLKQITIPVHTIYALESDFVSPENAKAVTDLNREKITIDFVEGTHMVPNEDPDALVPQIMKLVDRVNSKENRMSSRL